MSARPRAGSVRSLLRWVRASPLVRLAFLAAVLACCGYSLAAQWPGVRAALNQMHWYLVAGSVLAAMAGAGAMMLAWRALLADLGSPLPVATTARITFVGQLGKYVPGAIWSFAAHVELGHYHGVPRRRGAASVVTALAVTVAVGLAIAAFGLPLAVTGAGPGAGAARHYQWAVAALPVIGVCLCPPVLGRLTDRGLRVIRLPPLERRPTWRGLAVAAGWTGVGWLLLGLQVWLPLAALTGRGAGVLLLAVGGYALACSVALVLVVFPNGIGPREVILIAALAPVLDRPAALALALLVRAATTIADLAWGAIGLAVARPARTAEPVSGAQPVRPAQPVRTVSATERTPARPLLEADAQGTS